MKGRTVTQSACSFLDSIVSRARGLDDVPDMAVREQAALVRALLDEVERRPPTDPRSVDLGAQLEEEITRLARLLDDESATGPREPAS